MMDKEFYVISFDSTHYAIQMENRLKNKFRIETIPTPREISASCGLSIKFKVEIFDDIMKELENEKEKQNIFKVKRNGREKEVTKV